MSWLVKRWGKGQYGIWTTIADGYLHEPKKISREEAIEVIAQSWKEDLADKIADLTETFPNGWFDKDTYRKITNEPLSGSKDEPKQ